MPRTLKYSDADLSHLDDSKNPDFLYKYQPFNNCNAEHIKKILCNNTIYFSSPDSFNDVYDGHMTISFDGKEEEKESKLHKIYEKFRPDLDSLERNKLVGQHLREGNFDNIHKRLILPLIHKKGIYSLTDKNDSLLMWSHYADHHRGICFQFKRDINNPFFCLAHPVRYRLDYPSINYFRNEYKDFFITLLVTKSQDWEYESEWRIIDDVGNDEYYYPPELLNGIIFGCRTSEERISDVCNWIKHREQKIKLYKAVMKEKQFGLRIEEIPLL